MTSLVPVTRNGSGESILRTFEGAYVAVVANDDVDTHRFERLLADGRRAAEAEDPRRSSDALAQAIALGPRAHRRNRPRLPAHNAERVGRRTSS